jgi:hypothetical protein
METSTQGAPGYYVWEIAGKSVVVHLHLEVIDRLLSEVMRGFGAVPKRGAEVGGVLIGTIETGNPCIVRIEDFEVVECDYRRGPSYLFTDEDSGAFDEACERWQPDESRPAYAIGYFRSQTRDGFMLSAEDIEIMDRNFPSPYQIALLVKPYGTKVSTGGFFFREDGVFQQTTPLEFPFRRRELAGEEPPPRRSMTAGRPRMRRPRTLVPSITSREPDEDYAGSEPMPSVGSAYAVTAPAQSRLRKGWVWLPLSFIFLLLGVLLGFQAALNINPRTSTSAAQDFELGLSISKSDENLSIKWDRQSPAIRTAQTGVLEIEDGKYTNSVDLDAAQLQNGNIIYRNSSKAVTFRLTVYPKSKVSVSETMEWRQ